jgi:hypothetical protein
MTERTKAQLERERRALRAEQRKLDDLYREYNERIDALTTEIRARWPPPPPKRPTDAMRRYMESDDTPMRRCAGCHEPMLTATIANAQVVRSTIVDNEVRETPPEYIGATDLRGMRQATFCCFCCERRTGHSRECFSASEQARRRQEGRVYVSASEQDRRLQKLLSGVC